MLMSTKESITRKEFFRSGLKSILKLVDDVTDQQVESKAKKMVVPLIRPPGAIDEASFLLKCTGCDLCARACPHDAVIPAEAKFGSAVGTPIIRPARNPCYLCEDFPCINACPEGALLPVVKVKMGIVHLIQNNCFAHNGQNPTCDYCYERCPLKDEAIVMEEDKPKVVEENCTGCGICEFYCPVQGNAIMVLPKKINYTTNQQK